MPMQPVDDSLPASVNEDATACGDQAALAPNTAVTSAEVTGRDIAPGRRASASCTAGVEGPTEQTKLSLQAKQDIALIAFIGIGHASNAPVMARFLGLCGNPTLDGAALAQCYEMVRLLWHCQYSVEEVCTVLAHTSKYFSDLRSACASRMGPTEAGNILVAQAYIAHCFVIDETCPLCYWHRFLCAGYCDLATLDAAVIQLMKKRNYKLRLDDRELRLRHDVLFLAATAVRH